MNRIALCLIAGTLHLVADPARANPERDALDRTCKAGRAEDCVTLAILWAEGDRGPEDPKRALALFERACTLSHARGCHEGARYHEAGVHVPADLPRATAMYDRGCELGHGEACRANGRLFKEGATVAVDLARARKLFDGGCRLADAPSCFELGVMVEQALGGPRDEAAAARAFRAGCDLKEPRCCARLGPNRPASEPVCAGPRCMRLELGRYREDISKIEPSIAFFRERCDGKDARACYKVATFIEARGEPDGATNAAYARACDLGASEACVNLGVRSLADIAAARPRFDTACARGDGLGCLDRGLLAMMSNPRDEPLAFGDFTRACDSGEALACLDAGLMLELGLGTPKDAAAARIRYAEACRGGVTEACE